MTRILHLAFLMGATLSCLPGYAADSAWPFDQPSLSVLRQSPKKVFAHYFPPFPLSLDNKSPANDYYTMGYLSPAGESYKHLYCGG